MNKKQFKRNKRWRRKQVTLDNSGISLRSCTRVPNLKFIVRETRGEGLDFKSPGRLSTYLRYMSTFINLDSGIYGGKTFKKHFYHYSNNIINKRCTHIRLYTRVTRAKTLNNTNESGYIC